MNERKDKPKDTMSRRVSRLRLNFPFILDNFMKEERLKECGRTTLATQILRGDQIEVFKILTLSPLHYESKQPVLSSQ